MTAPLLPFVIFLLAATCIGGLLYAAFLPRLAAADVSARRIQKIARHEISAADRSRKRSVEDILKEIEEKQKSVQKNRRRPTLLGRMRQAGLTWSKRTYWMVAVICGAAGHVAAVILGGLPLLPAAGFGIAAGLFLPHAYVGFRRGRRLKRFSAELPSALDVIVRGIKTGLPLVDCLKIVATESEEPLRSEFRIVLEDQTLGLTMDEAVQRLAERVPLQETTFLAIVIGIQTRTGGSLSEALGNLSRVVRERRRMKAKIKAMSAEAKASGGIIGSLPVIVAALVYLTSPDYISLLFTTLPGNLVLAGSGVWMLMGILVMRKMINFDF